MLMQMILQRIEARVRRRLLAGAALLSPLTAAALVPTRVACTILDAIASISVEGLAGLAAATNALTLMP